MHHESSCVCVCVCLRVYMCVCVCVADCVRRQSPHPVCHLPRGMHGTSPHVPADKRCTGTRYKSSHYSTRRITLLHAFRAHVPYAARRHMCRFHLTLCLHVCVCVCVCVCAVCAGGQCVHPTRHPPRAAVRASRPVTSPCLGSCTGPMGQCTAHRGVADSTALTCSPGMLYVLAHMVMIAHTGPVAYTHIGFYEPCMAGGRGSL